MKSFLLCFLLIVLLSFSGCVSQQVATKEEITHEYIVEYPGLTKDLIFNRTLKWIANNFRSAKQVIEYQDKEAGSIVGNGITPIKAEGALLKGVDMAFTMNIDIKENRVRYRFIKLKLSFRNLTPMPDTQAWHRPARMIFDIIVGSLIIATNETDEF